MPLHALSARATRSIPVGLELYSVRNELKKDPDGTVRAVAQMGYQGVEFYAPYFEWSESQTKQMRKLLDDLGMRCFSTHNDSSYLSPAKIGVRLKFSRRIRSHRSCSNWMWARAWRQAPIQWRGFAQIRAESGLSISKTGRRKRRKATPFCSGKARQSGKTFSKRPKARAGPSTTSSSRKAADSRNLKPRAAACSPSGSSI